MTGLRRFDRCQHGGRRHLIVQVLGAGDVEYFGDTGVLLEADPCFSSSLAS